MRFVINDRHVTGPIESMLSDITAREIQSVTRAGCRFTISDRVRLISVVSCVLDRLQITMFEIWSSIMDGLIPRHSWVNNRDPVIFVGPWTVSERYIMYNGDVIEHVIPVHMWSTSGRHPNFVFYNPPDGRCLGTSDVVVKMLIIGAMIMHGEHHLY